MQVPALPRSLTTLIAIGAVAVLSLTAAPPGVAAPRVAVTPRPAPQRAGLTGPAITLTTNAQLSGYDMATDGSSKAYIGWIGDTGSGRKVFLCTLPSGATSCAGGIQSIDSLGDSSAQGLQVLATSSGHVTLVWFHDTTASLNGPQGSEIATATSQSGGPLSAPSDVATAPSFGEMMDAVLAPDGSIWVLTSPLKGTDKIQLRPGLANPFVTVTTPYVAGVARLAFSGTTAVLAVEKDGSISQPVSYATDNGGSVSAFRNVANTRSLTAVGLAETTSGVRMIATIQNATYWPVVSRFTASGFSRPTLTGDKGSCFPASHDTVADASGRLADVSMECGHDVAIANLPDTTHATVVRFNVHGTFAGGPPQLTTAPSGRGWVAWSIESASGDKLLVAPLLLPDRTVTATRKATSGRVTLTGPATCLPPVNVAIGVKGSAAAGWRVASKKLLLGGTTLHSTTLHGGSLTPGASYVLAGKVTFASGGSRRTVTATIRFRSCPSP